MLRDCASGIHMQWVVAFFLTTIPSISAPDQIPRWVTLAKVEYQGLSLFTPAEINAVAGLKIGQKVDSADLDNAARILTYWGYFRTVQYNYRYSGTQLTLAFQIGEKSRFYNCIFDNFLGFSDQELIAAIQRDLPSFKGKVPESGTALQDMAHILEKFISRKEIRKTVTSSAVYDQARKDQTLVFTIDNFKSPICKIDFDGEDKEILPLLEKASMKLVNTPYSRCQIDSYSRQDMSSFLQTHGYWKFGIKSVSAESMSTPDCTAGAKVTISFNSGGKFTWSGAIWSGAMIRSVSELNSLISITPGETANQRAVEAGLINVATAYLKNGYVDYRLLATRPIIDALNHRVSYQVEIKEGSQYLMGRFFPINIPGLSLPGDKLINQWQLKRGEVFDAVYFEDFKEKHFKPWCNAHAPNSGLTLVYSQNRNDMTVNILVAPPPPARKM